MDFNKIQVDDTVWTMIGNYPYEVQVIRLAPCNVDPPRGTFQNDHVWVWRANKGTTHYRKPHEIFESEEELKNFLFPPKN